MRGVKPLDLVETVREGLLVLEPDLTIRFVNRSFCRTFASAPEHTVGRKFYEIGRGQREVPKLRRALETIISGRKTIRAFEVEYLLPLTGRRTLMLNARKVYRLGNKISRSPWRSKPVFMASFANMPAGSGVDYLWSVARKL